MDKKYSTEEKQRICGEFFTQAYVKDEKGVDTTTVIPNSYWCDQCVTGTNGCHKQRENEIEPYSSPKGLTNLFNHLNKAHPES